MTSLARQVLVEHFRENCSVGKGVRRRSPRLGGRLRTVIWRRGRRIAAPLFAIRYQLISTRNQKYLRIDFDLEVSHM